MPTAKTPIARKAPTSKTAAAKAPAKVPAKALTKTRAKPLAAKPAMPDDSKILVVDASPKLLKHKLVRDSFTIPKIEYAVLQGLKQRAAELKRPIKKSEILRAGVSALRAMSDEDFLTALDAVPSLKTGRPKTSGTQDEVAAKL